MKDRNLNQESMRLWAGNHEIHTGLGRAELARDILLQHVSHMKVAEYRKAVDQIARVKDITTKQHLAIESVKLADALLKELEK